MQSDQYLHLVCAGGSLFTLKEEDFLQHLNIIERTLQYDVADDLLYWLYKGAAAFVYPSLYEGFGLPILEAFQHQLPVIVANNTCLPEVGGNAVLTFDPFHVDELVEKIILIIADAQLRATLIENGNNRLAEFSWKNTANELLAVFKATKKHYTES